MSMNAQRPTSDKGLQIEGALAYFMHLKCQKRIGDDVGNLKYVFTKKNKKHFFVKMTPLIRFIQLIMQEYDSKCLKMCLITLKGLATLFHRGLRGEILWIQLAVV
jgi:hypothetical protein